MSVEFANSVPSGGFLEKEKVGSFTNSQSESGTIREKISNSRNRSRHAHTHSTRRGVSGGPGVFGGLGVSSGSGVSGPSWFFFSVSSRGDILHAFSEMCHDVMRECAEP